jgi:hypothetical protein
MSIQIAAGDAHSPASGHEGVGPGWGTAEPVVVPIPASKAGCSSVDQQQLKDAMYFSNTLTVTFPWLFAVKQLACSTPPHV